MGKLPAPVAEFQAGNRFTVAGASRHPAQAAYAGSRKRRAAGDAVAPITPTAPEAEGARC